MSDFTGAAWPLSPDGLARALDLLHVGAPEVWTVLTVETCGFGFLEDRRPLILFERHIFSRETAGLFDAANPAISSKTPGGYAGGRKEYERLHAAISLNRHAALNSASWGIGQVMGFNSKLAGYDNVEAMVGAMFQHEDAQLECMARFLLAENLHQPLQSRDWTSFARRYNGADYGKNQYDARLAAAYRKFSSHPLPDLRVRHAQALLTYLGIDPGAIDGIAGIRTTSAVAQFRKQNGLGDSGLIDDGLIAALRERVSARTPVSV